MKIKYLIALWLAIAIVGSYFLGYTPLLLPIIYLSLSVLTYVIYAKDKSAAKSKTWRIPEKTLHLLSLCGGWLGAALAQETLRHKTQKTSFQVVFWLTVVANVTGFSALHLEQINNKLRLVMEKVSDGENDKVRPSAQELSRYTIFQYSR